MLTRLQKKTLIPTQIAGYAATLLVGAAIIMLACQLYADIKPLLTQQTDVFRGHVVTLSKNVGALQALNKSGIYFSEREIAALEGQPFVQRVAHFRTSTFHTRAELTFGSQGLSTDLFFEAVPARYIDVRSDQWRWDSTQAFIPVIIPEDYLSLYNFGFAESQSLPVVSQGLVKQVPLAVTLWGNGRRQTFSSRIVGFSGKINTILVPEEFLRWANDRFGESADSKPSRLLVEFRDASDERIPAFLESHNYNIKQDELEASKMVFFFRMAMAFLLTVALIIIALSVAFIIMSLNVIVQKNRSLFVNLYTLGYTPKQIARYYRRVVSLITVADMAVALVVALALRALYCLRLSTMFSIEGSVWPIIIAAVVLTAALVIIYNYIILRTVRRMVEPRPHTD